MMMFSTVCIITFPINVVLNLVPLSELLSTQFYSRCKDTTVLHLPFLCVVYLFTVEVFFFGLYLCFEYCILQYDPISSLYIAFEFSSTSFDCCDTHNKEQQNEPTHFNLTLETNKLAWVLFILITGYSNGGIWLLEAADTTTVNYFGFVKERKIEPNKHWCVTILFVWKIGFKIYIIGSSFWSAGKQFCGKWS